MFLFHNSENVLASLIEAEENYFCDVNVVYLLFAVNHHNVPLKYLAYCTHIILIPILHFFLISDYSFDAAEDEAGETCSPLRGALYPETERNPSPPPDTSDGDEAEVTDAIGDTVYSKRWLFSTLSRLIQVMRQNSFFAVFGMKVWESN